MFGQKQPAVCKRYKKEGCLEKLMQTTKLVPKGGSWEGLVYAKKHTVFYKSHPIFYTYKDLIGAPKVKEKDATPQLH